MQTHTCLQTRTSLPSPQFNVDKILAEVDVDRDGRICYSEFCDMLRNQPEPALFEPPEGGEGGGNWGAWGEATDSGRLLLALPPDSRATTRCNSLADSRNGSSNDRTLASGRSIGRSMGGRSMGGTSMYNESRFAPSRSSRPSQAGSHRPSNTGSNRPSNPGTRPSIAGTRATSGASSVNSRFGSMRAAAAFATDAVLHSANENLQRAVLAQAAAAAAIAAVAQEQAAAAAAAAAASTRTNASGSAMSGTSGPESPNLHGATECAVPEPTARISSSTDGTRATAAPRSALAQPARGTPTPAWPDNGGRAPAPHVASVREQGVRWRDEEEAEVTIEKPRRSSLAPAAGTPPADVPLSQRASAPVVATTCVPAGAAPVLAAPATCNNNNSNHPHRTSPQQQPRTSPNSQAAAMRPHPPPAPPPPPPPPGAIPSFVDRTPPGPDDEAAAAAPTNAAAQCAASPLRPGSSEAEEGAVAEAPRRSPLAARRVHVVANDQLGCTGDMANGAQARQQQQLPRQVAGQQQVQQVRKGDEADRLTRSAV